MEKLSTSKLILILDGSSYALNMIYIEPTQSEWSKCDPHSLHPLWFIVTSAEYEDETPKSEWDIDYVNCDLNILRDNLLEFKSSQYAFKSDIIQSVKSALNESSFQLEFLSNEFGNLVYVMHLLEDITKATKSPKHLFSNDKDPLTLRPILEFSPEKNFVDQKEELLDFLDDVANDAITTSKIDISWGSHKYDRLKLDNKLLLKHLQDVFRRFRLEESEMQINKHSDFMQLVSSTEYGESYKKNIPFNPYQLNMIHQLAIKILPSESQNAISTFIMHFLFEMKWLNRETFVGYHSSSEDEHSLNVFIGRQFINSLRAKKRR